MWCLVINLWFTLSIPASVRSQYNVSALQVEMLIMVKAEYKIVNREIYFLLQQQLNLCEFWKCVWVLQNPWGLRHVCTSVSVRLRFCAGIIARESCKEVDGEVTYLRTGQHSDVNGQLCTGPYLFLNSDLVSIISLYLCLRRFTEWKRNIN